jgi:hypothetical protein
MLPRSDTCTLLAYNFNRCICKSMVHPTLSTFRSSKYEADFTGIIYKPKIKPHIQVSIDYNEDW